MFGQFGSVVEVYFDASLASVAPSGLAIGLYFPPPR